MTLPLPEHAAELQRFDGRWAREFQAERRGVARRSASTAENRRGRTSHEHPPLIFAGEAGFGEWHGEVWGVHLAWSGNHTMLAERLDDGRRYVQVGELLHPGEIVLEAGETYTTPEVVAVYSGDGLTPGDVGVPPLAAGTPDTPGPAPPGDAQHVGGGVLRPRPRAAGRARRRGGRGRHRAVRARRRMVRVAT